jgi:hypothetical protein|tara:strand:+ start:63 stop:806 length:744 start_codon:yes stop_codon:yes gene_type:complete
MFRKGGGTNMNGIMSGIEDRQNFQEGMSARQRLEKVAEQYPSQAVDPLGQFLIEGGLNLMSQTGGGGLLGNIGKALKEPTAGLFKAQAGKDKFKRELALAGEQLDIEQEQALKLAEMKAKNTTGDSLQKDYSPERIYYESLKQLTDPKAATGFTRTIEQDYPEAYAEYRAYIGPSIRKNPELKQKFIGTLPNQKKGKTRQFRFEEMIPGGLYFKPDVKKLYERDPEKNILIEYSPYTGEKLREIPLG